MDMKINADRIIALRKEKAWSQQHLSDTSSLSLRTIQRVEKTAKASNETIRSIASAFEVDVKTLLVNEKPEAVGARIGWKTGGLFAALSLIGVSLFTAVAVTNADEIKVSAEEVVSTDGIVEQYNGNVGIAVPIGQKMQLSATELWTSGDATFVQGEVEITVGTKRFQFDQGTVLKSADGYLIHAESVMVSQSDTMDNPIAD